MSVNPIPTGCNSINVYLIVKDARAAMEFYAKAFNGTTSACMEAPDGSVMHGEVQIGNSTIMLSQENPEWELKSAETLGGSPASIHLYTEDCDAIFAQAVENGCTVIQPVMEMFWGDRYGKVADPFGFQWGSRPTLRMSVPKNCSDVERNGFSKRGIRRKAKRWNVLQILECGDVARVLSLIF